MIDTDPATGGRIYKAVIKLDESGEMKISKLNDPTE